jgi:phage gpG-like protein
MVGMGQEGFTSYSVDNDRRFREAIDQARRLVGDLTIPLGLIKNDFYRSQKAIWKLKSEGQYPDLSTKPFFAWWEKGDAKREYKGGYKEYKQAKWGFAYPILKQTGRLERAASQEGAAGNVTVVGKHSLVLGVDESAIPYAIFHQMGTRKIPMRKFVFIGPEAPRFATSEQAGRLSRWQNILMGYVLQKVKPVGRAA